MTGQRTATTAAADAWLARKPQSTALPDTATSSLSEVGSKWEGDGLIYASAVLREPLPRERIPGAAVIVLGLCVIGFEAVSTIGRHGLLGDLAIVAAGCCFATFAMMVKLWHIPPMRATPETLPRRESFIDLPGPTFEVSGLILIDNLDQHGVDEIAEVAAARTCLADLNGDLDRSGQATWRYPLCAAARRDSSQLPLGRRCAPINRSETPQFPNLSLSRRVSVTFFFSDRYKGTKVTFFAAS